VLHLRVLDQPILIAVLLFMCVGGANAQGLYYNYYIDDTLVSTETDGYPGNSCDNSPTDIWSNFQSGYESGFAPISIYQQGPTVNGGIYTWSIGFSMTVTDPYGGCFLYNYSQVVFQGPLREIIAYYYGSPLGGYTAKRCNPNNACDTLVGGNIPVTYMLATVYQIQIGFFLQCGIPRDKPPDIVDRCYKPDPLP
jgi:hypothetical protein